MTEKEQYPLLIKYLKSRKDQFFHIDVRMDHFPLTENDKIIVFIFPRLIGIGSEKDRIPLCVLGEKLCPKDAIKLTSVLSDIQDIRGLEPKEGLALIIQTYIIGLDIGRATIGKESILLGPSNEELSSKYNLNTEEGRKAIEKMIYSPIVSVRRLMEFWNNTGSAAARFIFDEERVKEPGIPYYFVIPPLWGTQEDLQELFQGKYIDKNKVKVYVERSLIPMIKRLPEFSRQLQDFLKYSATLAVNRIVFQDIEIQGSDKNFFRKKGDIWEIVYEGKRIFLSDLNGLHYIQYLLMNPDKEINAIDLGRVIDGFNTENANKTLSGMKLEQLEGMDLSKVYQLAQELDILDQKAVDDYKRRIGEIDDKISIKEDTCDQEGLGELKEEKETICRELKKAIGLSGRSRGIPGTIEKARIRVRSAITTVYKKIKDEHNELYTHLTSYIHLGRRCYYNPEKPPDWHFH